jgi:fucose 4-O-acetylase-like acetyltransferase
MSSRHVWADVARGACVLLVVLHHVIRQFVVVAPDAWFGAAAWTTVDSFLTPIRIPLFFFISGLLAARAVSRPWSEAKTRVTSPAYLYVIWSVLLSLRLLAPGQEPEAHGYVANLFWGLLLAGGGYWYLYALPLYFLICRFVRGRGWIVLIALSAAVNLMQGPVTIWTRELSAHVMDDPTLLASVAGNLLFFAVGVRHGNTLQLFARRLSGLSLTGVAALYSAVVLAGIFGFDSAPLALTASSLGLLLGAGLAMRGEGAVAATSTLGYIGARTLPVYVLQFFFISVLSFAWGRVGISDSVAEATQWVSWIYPPLTVVVALAASLAIHRVCMKTKLLSWLFVPYRSARFGRADTARPRGRHLSDRHGR